jgi:hypothetical protein
MGLYIYIYIYRYIYIRERYIPIFIFSENDCRCVEIIRRCQHIYIYICTSWDAQKSTTPSVVLFVLGWNAYGFPYLWNRLQIRDAFGVRGYPHGYVAPGLVDMGSGWLRIVVVVLWQISSWATYDMHVLEGPEVPHQARHLLCLGWNASWVYIFVKHFRVVQHIECC